MSNHTDPKRLVGKRVLMSVGEPWDFSSQDGENTLRGKISGLMIETDGSAVVLVDTTSFSFGSSAITQVICAGRLYRGRHVLHELLESRRIVSCNMYFNTFGEIVAEKDIPIIPIGRFEWVHFLIGSLTLVD